MINLSVDVKRGGKLEKLTNGVIEKCMEEAIQRTGIEAESECVKNAPVDTGTLRRSIGTTFPERTCCFITGIYYWVYVNYGTYKMNAQPFVTNASKKVPNFFDQNFTDAMHHNGLI